MSDAAENFKNLQDLMQAFFSNEQTPAGAVVVPKDYQLLSTEKFEPYAKRLRGTFSTALIEDFANYFARNVHADSLAHAPIFIDTQPLDACAILDWMVDDDRPGHLQHKASCYPKPLPEWQSLLQLHGKEISQDACVDMLEDFGACVSSFDDTGQGLAFSQLIAAFRNAKISKKSERAQSLEDSSVERSALETIDANASRRTPSRLTFHITPYEGFSARSITARVIIRVRNDEPVFTFRIVALESLEREIALEFVNLVQTAIAEFFKGDEAPAIYVGRFNW